MLAAGSVGVVLLCVSPSRRGSYAQVSKVVLYFVVSRHSAPQSTFISVDPMRE